MLLLGLRQPLDGEVKLDGMPASEWLRQHRGHVGYVGPEAMLFAGTILQNVASGTAAGMDPRELERRAAAMLGLAGLTAVPGEDLLHRVLTEDGEGLSAGQKQRIALARALMREPVLLVLDEASSNLDAESEARIIETLRSMRGKVTVIVVSHRPAMLATCDLVVRLGGGGVWTVEGATGRAIPEDAPFRPT
jgi:ABC-type bacteriocin/lantibiotic exporter with double-glycine peptidase domain